MLVNLRWHYYWQNYLLRKVLAIAVLLMFISGVTKPEARAQNSTIPIRTELMVEALRASQWQDLGAGVEVIRGIAPGGLIITGFKIDPQKFQFSLIASKDAAGMRAHEIGGKTGAALVINAGFFSETDEGRQSPVGYLRLNDQVLSGPWLKMGGYLITQEDGIHLSPSSDGVPAGIVDALQSKPMLIEPGGVWAMNTNLGNLKRRTIVCKMASGAVVLALITRSGASLYEAGWIMRDEKQGGFFGCDSALAMDGGGSTQVWVKDVPEYSFPGITKVHNFLILKRRSE